MINDLALLSSDIVRTHDLLRRFGPAAKNARADLIHYAVEKQEDLFPRSAGRAPNHRILKPPRFWGGSRTRF
jgi:hypothetical protein